MEIQCDDPTFGATGLRVAANPDVVWLATASATESFLHDAGLDATTRVELPAELARRTIILATAPSGELHLAAELIGSRDIVYLAEAVQPGDRLLLCSGAPHDCAKRFNDSALRDNRGTGLLL